MSIDFRLEIALIFRNCLEIALTLALRGEFHSKYIYLYNNSLKRGTLIEI